MPNISVEEHKQITKWAAECAHHVLHFFEQCSDDNRPRKAIEAALSWINGKIDVSEARKCAFAAHQAARQVENNKAKAAARSAGHAAATPHVVKHAKYASKYALEAADDINEELRWQLHIFPDNCLDLE